MNRLDELIAKYCPNGVDYTAAKGNSNQFDDSTERVCKIATIESICKKIVSGGTPMSTNSEYYTGTIPWLRTQEVDFCDIHETSLHITEEALISCSAQWIPENCVIVAMYGATAGKVAINKIPLTTNQACCNLLVDHNLANYKFVYHWLANQYYQIKSLGQGSQSNINARIVKEILIPLPPLPVQEEIVRILDKFTTLEAELEAELEARKKQFEYYLEQLLTYKDEVPLVKLGEVCKLYNGDRGKNYPSHTDYVNDGIPFVNAGDIEKGIVKTNSCNKISEQKYHAMGGAKLIEGDILYCLRGSVGKNGIFYGRKGTVASSLVAIRSSEKVNGKYLYYLLNSTMELRQRMIKDNGAAQPNLSAESVKNYVFPIPDMNKQNHIVSILDRFDTLVNDISQGLPAEIEARRKQYEYYRNQLLTFKEATP